MKTNMTKTNENPLKYGAHAQRAFEVFCLETGHDLPTTTFMCDFAIAECVSIASIRDTYKNAIAYIESRTTNGGDWRAVAELVCVLNHRLWATYEHDARIAREYDTLWRRASRYAERVLKGDALSNYFRYID